MLGLAGGNDNIALAEAPGALEAAIGKVVCGGVSAVGALQLWIAAGVVHSAQRCVPGGKQQQ